MHTSDIFQISIFAILVAVISLITGITDAAANSSSLDRKTREPAQKLIATTPLPEISGLTEDDYTTPEDDEEDDEEYTEEGFEDPTTRIPQRNVTNTPDEQMFKRGPLPGSSSTMSPPNEYLTSMVQEQFSSTTSSPIEASNEATLTIDEEEIGKTGSGTINYGSKVPPRIPSDYVEGSGGGPIGGDRSRMIGGGDMDTEDDSDVTDDPAVEGSGLAPTIKDVPPRTHQELHSPVREPIPGNELVTEGSGRGVWEAESATPPGQVSTTSTAALPPAFTEPNNDISFSTPDNAISPEDELFLKGADATAIVEKTPNQRTTLLQQPAMLAAVIGGAVVGLLCAILLVMYLIYRMRKKDEGSYALDEPAKRPGGYMRAPTNSGKEYYA